MFTFALICTAAACLGPVATTKPAAALAAHLGRRRRAHWAAIAGPALPAVYAVVPMAAVGKASQPASQRKVANG